MHLLRLVAPSCQCLPVLPLPAEPQRWQVCKTCSVKACCVPVGVLVRPCSSLQVRDEALLDLCALQAELVTAREGLQQAEASALAAAAQCTSLQQVGACRARLACIWCTPSHHYRGRELHYRPCCQPALPTQVSLPKETHKGSGALCGAYAAVLTLQLVLALMCSVGLGIGGRSCLCLTCLIPGPAGSGRGGAERQPGAAGSGAARVGPPGQPPQDPEGADGAPLRGAAAALRHGCVRCLCVALCLALLHHAIAAPNF